MKTEELKIEGMTCGHCVMSVRKELSKIPGVHIIDVQNGKATIEYDAATANHDTLAQAIEDAGYHLIS